MRVVGAAHRREVVLQHRLFVGFGEDRRVLAVLLDEVARRVERVGGLVEFVVYLHHEDLVLEPPAPMVLGVGLRLGPRRVLALDAVGLARREVPFVDGRQEVRGEEDALLQPLHVEVVHLEPEADVAGLYLVVNRQFALRKPVEVALEEHRVVEVVERHEVGPRAARDLVVEPLLQHVELRQHVAEALRDVAVVVLRLHRAMRRKDARYQH